MLMTLDELKSKLAEYNLKIFKERSISHGTQLTLKGGTVINHYNTGKIVVQGKDFNQKEKKTVEYICSHDGLSASVILKEGCYQEQNTMLAEMLNNANIPYTSISA